MPASALAFAEAMAAAAAEDDEDEYEYVEVEVDEDEDYASSSSSDMDAIPSDTGGGFNELFPLGEKPLLPTSGGGLGLGGGLDVTPRAGEGIYKEDGFDYLTPGKSLGREQSRSWSERLFYETGSCYLLGAFGGGAAGLFHGYRAAAETPFMRLKVNSMLNHGGKLASGYANTFGVFALFFSFSRSLAKNRRRKNDVYNDVIGVGTAGALVALPKGPVAAVTAGVSLGAIGSALIWLNIQRQNLFE